MEQFGWQRPAIYMPKYNPKKIILAFLPSIIWAGLIFFFSAQQMLPSLYLSVLDFLFKKTAHIFVYAVLYILVYQALTKVEVDPKKRWWLGLAVCLVYAVNDELHQAAVPGRTATLRDVGYDFLGMGIVILKQKNYI